MSLTDTSANRLWSVQLSGCLIASGCSGRNSQNALHNFHDAVISTFRLCFQSSLRSAWSGLTSFLCVLTVIVTIVLCSQVEKSAFVVGDLGALMRQHVCWQNVVPQLQPYYPVRCNSSPAVIEVLASLGLGFVCANKVSFRLH